MENITYKPNRVIPTTGYQKLFESSGDIIEYLFIYYRDEHLLANQPDISKRDLGKIKAILRKYGVVEFKCNLQLLKGLGE